MVRHPYYRGSAPYFGRVSPVVLGLSRGSPRTGPPSLPPCSPPGALLSAGCNPGIQTRTGPRHKFHQGCRGSGTPIIGDPLLFSTWEPPAVLLGLSRARVPSNRPASTCAFHVDDTRVPSSLLRAGLYAHPGGVPYSRGGHQGWKSPHVFILFTLAIFPNWIPSSSSPLPLKSRAAWSKNHAKTKPPAISRLPSLNIQPAQKDDSLAHGKESKSATASYSVRTALSCLSPSTAASPRPRDLFSGRLSPSRFFSGGKTLSRLF